MRFGLIGTGPWAHIAHGPGLLAAEEVDLVGVWGRSQDKAAHLASELDVSAYADLDALLDQVDAVAFAVPPEVQAELALTAARRGKHLLLDKPVAADPQVAGELVRVVEEAGVATVVFLTDRFSPEVRDWLADVRATAEWAGEWRGGWCRWLSALWVEGNPFGASPWRQQYGAVRDIGPHALSWLTASLGPVTSVRAWPGAADVAHLVVAHESGATSTVTVTHSASAEAEGFQLGLWGPAGVRHAPARDQVSADDALGTAAGELVAAAESGESHELDVRYGARLVELVAAAEAQLAAARDA